MKAIARRNGRPAWQDAPPRLRQSHITNPIRPMQEPQGLWGKLFDWRKG